MILFYSKNQINLKTTILHFIESLGRGGAEVLLVNYINLLPENFNNVVVYMRGPSILKSEFKSGTTVLCIDYKSKKSLPRLIYRFRKIVNAYEADIVHTHLYWPTIIARLAIRNKVPLVFSVHNMLSKDAFEPSVLSKYLEKITYRKNQLAVFVSKAVADDYKKNLKNLGATVVLHNFVRDDFFREEYRKIYNTCKINNLKLVSVGNLKVQKGYDFLINCMSKLSKYNITLDIYGEGPENDLLGTLIEEKNINNVRLMGGHPSVEQVLNNYDVFVMASTYEGFCIAMAEAMSIGLPCLVPNIDVFKEVSEDSQLYYKTEKDFIDKVLLLDSSPNLLIEYSIKSREIAQNYTHEEYMNKLNHIYQNLLLKRR